MDRDGVINETIVRDRKPYPPSGTHELVLVEGAGKLLQDLKDAGFLLIVVTNQPDVRRGSMSRADVEAIHECLSKALPLDDFFVCYHDDQDDCTCRKPRPGLLLQAAAKHDVDLTLSFCIGDRWRDIEAGVAAGCRTILIDYGYDERKSASDPSITVPCLSEAVFWILKEKQRDEARSKPV